MILKLSRGSSQMGLGWILGFENRAHAERCYRVTENAIY
jgi:hypothetical protein